MDIHRGVVAHMHRTTAAFDTLPSSEIAYSPVVFCIRNVTGELQSVNTLAIFYLLPKKSVSRGVNLDVSFLVQSFLR
jgi:hypothetical protein